MTNRMIETSAAAAARATGRGAGLRRSLGAGLFALCGLAMAATAAPASAQDASVERLGSFRDWSAFTYPEEGGTTCYMASRPTDARGDYTSRGEIYALVTHRPQMGSRDVVSFVIGYPFREDSALTVEIGDERFSMLTQDDMAWADAETDAALVEAMRGGTRMVVRGTSRRGTATTDTYSLMGFTAAYNAITEACS